MGKQKQSSYLKEQGAVEPRVSIGRQLRGWVAGMFIAVLTMFSDTLVGSIKDAINKSNGRMEVVQSFSVSVNEYLFAARTLGVYIKSDAMTPEIWNEIVGMYDKHHWHLFTKEIKYRTLVDRYWSREYVDGYDRAFEKLKSVHGEVEKLQDVAKKANQARVKSRKSALLLTSNDTAEVSTSLAVAHDGADLNLRRYLMDLNAGSKSIFELLISSVSSKIKQYGR